jgi:hypothetical protein
VSASTSLGPHGGGGAQHPNGSLPSLSACVRSDQPSRAFLRTGITFDPFKRAACSTSFDGHKFISGNSGHPPRHSFGVAAVSTSARRVLLSDARKGPGDSSRSQRVTCASEIRVCIRLRPSTSIPALPSCKIVLKGQARPAGRPRNQSLRCSHPTPADGTRTASEGVGQEVGCLQSHHLALRDWAANAGVAAVAARIGIPGL